MNILLDEQIDWRLGRLLPDHQVLHVNQAGWKGIQNGELLKYAQDNSQVLITTDQNIPSQNKMGLYSIGIIVLRVFSNSIKNYEQLLPHLHEALHLIIPHQVIVIYQSGNLRRKDESRGKLQEWDHLVFYE